MRTAKTLLVVLGAAMPLLVVSTVGAHPPYERQVGVLGGPSVDQVILVKSYIDGIVFTDPVALIVRDRSGAIVAETEYARDLAILCWSATACAVFQYDGFLPVVPVRVWRLSTRGLTSDESRWLWLVGVVAPYFEHWLGYLAAVASFLVPLAVLVGLARWRASALRSVAMALIAVVAMLVLPAWLYLIVALSELSLPLVGALIAAAIGVHAGLRRGTRHKTAVMTQRVPE